MLFFGTVSKCDETISHSEKAHFLLSSSSYRSFSVVVYSMCVCLSTSEARSAEEVERQTRTIEKKYNRGGMFVLLLSLCNMYKESMYGLVGVRTFQTSTGRRKSARMT